MTPSSLTLRLLLVRVTATGDLPAFVYEDKGEHHILMKMVGLLYNLRARTVGINQIKNLFMRHLDVNANKEMNMM